MTTVFRVEKLDGTGPYSGSDYIYEMVEAHSDDYHSTPQADHLLKETGQDDIWLGKRGISVEEYCCFQTEADLYAWFDGWEEELAAKGYSVTIYSVSNENLRHGTTQSVFKRDEATLLSRSPLKIKEYA